MDNDYFFYTGLHNPDELTCLSDTCTGKLVSAK